MSKYKGNVGNLMQHWTLCEALNIAQGSGVTSLNYIDAHAMAPLADACANPAFEFLSVQRRLPGQGSVYEEAWLRLTRRDRVYPNSAAFVTALWQGPFSLSLCESDDATARELAGWRFGPALRGESRVGRVHPGDWRERFAKGIPAPCQVELPDDALTLVSFDPDMYDRRWLNVRNTRHLYPDDLELARRALDGFDGGVLIQLSTYAANKKENPQGAVLSSVNEILARGGFSLAAAVWANEKMMSLVYARNVAWSAELADLPGRFDEWLGGTTQPTFRRGSTGSPRTG